MSDNPECGKRLGKRIIALVWHIQFIHVYLMGVDCPESLAARVSSY
jgi:hypothetical protein